jgi:hypothetical protein
MEAPAATPAARKSSWAGVVGGIAAAVSILAGIYLFQTESASEDATIFDALFKAIGAYFVARASG